MSEDRPTPIEALAEVRDAARSLVRTAIPAFVLAYDEARNEVQVQPSRMGRDRDGVPIRLPVVGAVPVAWPAFAGAMIRGTLLPGDEVLLLIADRELDPIRGRPGLVPSSSDRMHSIQDAVALPIRLSGVPAHPPTAGGLVMGREDGTAQIRITLAPGGVPEVTVEGATIRLGGAAVLAAARVSDPVQAAADMAAWIAAAHPILVAAAALLTLPFAAPLPVGFGLIQSGSSKVLAE